MNPSKRKFPEATPEQNNGIKLTQIVQTRSPLDALKMLRAGQPIDIMLGYYVDSGEATKDVYMMDKLEKLHLLEELKQNKKAIQEDVKQKLREHNESLKQQNNDKKESATTTPQAASPGQEASPPPGGTQS